MIRENPFLGPGLSSEEVIQALVEYVAWCCAVSGNQAGTIYGKLAAIQYFHRVDHGRELPINSDLVKRALQGVTRAHERSGMRARIRHPVSWKCLLAGQGLAESWGPGGRVLWLSLALSFQLLARSDEMFASANGAINPVHCLTRDDVALYDGEEELPFGKWHRATRAVVYFRGHKGDQERRGSVIVRTRDVCRGSRSKVDADGGAVAILVELLSIHPALPKTAPLSSFRTRQGVQVWGYTHALRALRQIVAESGDNPREVGLHSLRIGAATALAAGGVIPDRIIQREGRWRSEVFKVYTRRNLEDAELVSRRLVRGV